MAQISRSLFQQLRFKRETLDIDTDGDGTMMTCRLKPEDVMKYVKHPYEIMNVLFDAGFDEDKNSDEILEQKRSVTLCLWNCVPKILELACMHGTFDALKATKWYGHEITYQTAVTILRYAARNTDEIECLQIYQHFLQTECWISVLHCDCFSPDNFCCDNILKILLDTDKIQVFKYALVKMYSLEEHNIANDMMYDPNYNYRSCSLGDTYCLQRNTHRTNVDYFTRICLKSCMSSAIIAHIAFLGHLDLLRFVLEIVSEREHKERRCVLVKLVGPIFFAEKGKEIFDIASGEKWLTLMHVAYAFNRCNNLYRLSGIAVFPNIDIVKRLIAMPCAPSFLSFTDVTRLRSYFNKEILEILLMICANKEFMSFACAFSHELVALVSFLIANDKDDMAYDLWIKYNHGSLCPNEHMFHGMITYMPQCLPVVAVRKLYDFCERLKKRYRGEFSQEKHAYSLYLDMTSPYFDMTSMTVNDALTECPRTTMFVYDLLVSKAMQKRPWCPKHTYMTRFRSALGPEDAALYNCDAKKTVLYKKDIAWSSTALGYICKDVKNTVFDTSNCPDDKTVRVGLERFPRNLVWPQVFDLGNRHVRKMFESLKRYEILESFQWHQWLLDSETASCFVDSLSTIVLWVIYQETEKILCTSSSS
jgi:hypothetical protein